MNKGIITALIACFFGAALSAACDPDVSQRPFELVPTFGSNDDLAGPGACSEAESEQACRGTLTCVWSNDRCSPMGLASAP